MTDVENARLRKVANYPASHFLGVISYFTVLNMETGKVP